MAIIRSTPSSTPLWSPQATSGLLLPAQPLVDVAVDTVTLTGNALSNWSPPPANFGLTGSGALQGRTASGTASLNAGLGGSSFQVTGGGNVSVLTGSLPTNTVNLTGNGLSATTDGDASLLRATGRAQAQGNLGPVSLTGNATGSVDLGRFTQQGQGSLQFGPNGLQAQGEYNQRLALVDAQGSVNGSAQLGPLRATAGLDGALFIGSRTQVGRAAIAQPGIAPGAAAGAATLNIGPNGTDVNVGFNHFTGAEAQATLRTGLETPVGNLSQATTARVAYGAGATGGLVYQSTQSTFETGIGGSFEVGRQAGLRQETGLTTPGGSVLNLTTAAGVGDPSGEASLGFARDNNTGTTRLGGTLIVPIPGTPITGGGGAQLSVRDSDLESGVRLLGGPLVGDAAASFVVPTMNTIPSVAPVVGEALWNATPAGQAVRFGQQVAQAAPALQSAAPVAAEVLVNASGVGAAVQVGQAIAENPGVAAHVAATLLSPAVSFYRWATE